MEYENINIYSQYMYSYPHKKAYKWLDNEVVLKALKNINNESLSLYFHIPFCSTKCGYCNLFSVTNTSLIDDYIEAMCRQIKQYSEILENKTIKIDSIIFGGGTPFILSENHFNDIFNALEKYFGIKIEEIGFDIETSPKETDAEKLKYIVNRGVNRISIGVQSFEETELKFLYRKHNIDDCKKALDLLNIHRPKILNIDIIYGIPNQTKETFKNSVDEALKYKPEEIFIYPLYLRQGTFLANHEDVADIEKHNLYLYIANYLKSMGYFQTSMRRFVKNMPRHESSCGFEKTLSFGCGGRSYIDELHFCEAYETGSKACADILEKYIQKIDFTRDVKGFILNNDEMSRRFIIKNLGYYRGVSKAEFFEYFGQDITENFKVLLDEFLSKGYIEISEEFIKLSDKGLGLSDYVLELFTSNYIERAMLNA